VPRLEHASSQRRIGMRRLNIGGSGHRLHISPIQKQANHQITRQSAIFVSFLLLTHIQYHI